MNANHGQPTNPVLRAALAYLVLGWSVLAIEAARLGDRTSGKRPLGPWREFIRVRPTAAQVERDLAAHDDANLAVLCGRPSGVVVVDADSPSAIAWLRARLPTTPLVCRTGSGEHHYYAWPGVEVRPATKLNGIPLDIRGDGSIVVAPPSRHWSGCHYEWTVAPSTDILRRLPPFDPHWFAQDRRHSGYGPIVENDRMRLIRRAMRYVDKLPSAVAGSGGHNATMRVAGVLVQRFGLTIAEAMPIMLMYNARCEPPWRDKDLMHKLTDAARRTAAAQPPEDTR